MSIFEEAVIGAISAHGYKVVPQVGSAGFFVDIGVCDPENPERFVLGIECDGAKYHSAKSARDRDRLREEVLKKRGWRIHRIWSTDWWKNPERELKRTLQVIEQAIASEGPPTSSNPANALQTEVIRERAAPHNSTEHQNNYVFARLRLELRGFELRTVPAQRMAEWVQQVVQVESPVHFDEVVRRIREAAGLERAGNPIREAVLQGAQYAARQGKIVLQDQFLWKMPIQPPVIRNRSMLLNHLKKIELVHPGEIKAAIMKVVEQAFGISREEAVTASMRLLGFERVTELMRERTDRLISELVDNGSLCELGGKLRSPDH
jgi:very-short-patch-repair endonuclease